MFNMRYLRMVKSKYITDRIRNPDLRGRCGSKRSTLDRVDQIRHRKTR